MLKFELSRCTKGMVESSIFRGVLSTQYRGSMSSSIYARWTAGRPDFRNLHLS
ncbi:predicted protein [Botrytis cinerea T4]|uniref:Uncharacterized protein n=1 Tax=Botryotinia fuckeliana (strain T4) TaxID=999810 RepID=G2Y782_BOTF4|nr:predicted protein [Botrytis cinerea T4]